MTTYTHQLDVKKVSGNMNDGDMKKLGDAVSFVVGYVNGDYEPNMPESEALDLLRKILTETADDEICDRLRKGIKHMKVARALAMLDSGVGATSELAVIARNADGSGSIGASLSFDGFIADIEKLVGEVPEPSESDIALGRFKGATGL